jgi:hypothetical protein
MPNFDQPPNAMFEAELDQGKNMPWAIWLINIKTEFF